MENNKLPDTERLILHRPVMCPEVVKLLTPRPGQKLLDVTMGTGGHSILIGKHLGQNGLIVGMDADESALKVAGHRFDRELDCPARLFHGHFSEAEQVVEEVGVDGFDLIIADLGLGTHQLDNPARGFSFDSDTNLDMRFDAASGRSAAEVINNEAEGELADIFYRLGQERYSRQIASEILQRRRRESISSARELAKIAEKIYAARSRGRKWRIHPATRIFMALRIYVNAELDELDRLLELIPRLAALDGKVAIITYHSLEARRVKHAWRRQEKNGVLGLITKKPLMPCDQEVSENPRARSAQLRVARIKVKT